MSEQETKFPRTRKAVEAFSYYRTPLPVDASFTIPCASGDSWLPFGYDVDRRLIFRVKQEDAERFERHLFFKQGRLEKYNYEPQI
ncbi:hypothetical protein HNP12_000647 [Aeromonas hydrophila]|uniref:hypothetical protein n=1 Tax=Aeromonas hydrophila TaxID=644 RepID=UPI00216AA321|nr:hypothetical protein [Aeromonas hydrophila]MCS3766599.1 hypothetical protein [Aeromonas hydrophila]